MQALILAGGEGTRLRPLTSTVPKPVVPLVDRPFIAFMLDWLRSHGVDDVVMSCGHMASGVRSVLGDGESVGLRLRYLEEPRPLGTGGALKFAEDMLDEQFLMLNGDVLTDLDLTASWRRTRRRGRGPRSRCTPSRTPRRTGSCAWPTTARCASSSRSRRRTRSTRTTSRPVRTCWNARSWSCLKRGERASIERDVFPRLVGDGLYGHVGAGYWKDIGTPERYLEATFDILEGTVKTEVAGRLSGFVCVEDGVANAGRSCPPRWWRAAAGSRPARTSAGARCSQQDVSVGEGTTIESAVVMRGASIGANCTLRGCVVAAGARIGDHCVIDGMSVIGEGVVLGADNVVSNGARLFPGVTLPDGGLKF